MSLLIEIIGWGGAAGVLAAYGLLSAKKLSGHSYAYHGLNMIGALLLGVYAFYKDATASLFVNGIWLLIGIAAVLALKGGKKDVPRL